jgi:DNA polymerase elongation subunit (family B)
LSIYYLMDAAVSEKDQGIKMTFFNPSENKWKEVLDTEYHPYFFIPYPTPEEDLIVIQELKLRTDSVEKTDLFSRQNVKLTRVELADFSDPRQISNRFSKSWEKDVSVISSYMYDKNLVFGAQYRINSKEITPLADVSKKDLQDFERSFSEIRKNNPEKYKLSKRLFILCSQSIPEVNLERLGIGNKVDSEELHSMFMLARLANISIPSTYRARQVSVWIKSILHNYLRKNNMLIPTAEELRQGEEAHSVKGALTLTPEPGVHLNTVVVDFDSMYPSLIDSYNLSHETIDCADEECKSNKVPGLDHYVCTKRRGVYSIIVGSLKDLRIHWFKPRSKDKALTVEKRILAESTSHLLKLVLVSSYGVVIRIHGISRSSLGESITAYGRFVLKSAYKIAKKKGLRPIYGDTDSLFLENPSEEEIDWLIENVKKQLKLDLSVEVRYTLCVLSAASKAYFGIKKDGTYDIKGLTAIKSNSPSFIQNVFETCIKELTTVRSKSELSKAKHKIEGIVQNAVENLVSGKISMKDLEYSVVIHDDPVKKVKGSSFHQPYQCAIQLLDAGQKVRRGDEMHFVKVKTFLYQGRKFTVKPTEHVKRFNEVNVLDYIRNLRTALNQTFEPMNIEFRDQNKSGKTLLDFT